MANVKFVAVSRGLKDILDYVTSREKTTDSLISGVNCVARTALEEFETVKKQFRKTDGRGYYHIVQAFAPDDPLDFDTRHFQNYFANIVFQTDFRPVFFIKYIRDPCIKAFPQRSSRMVTGKIPAGKIPAFNQTHGQSIPHYQLSRRRIGRS